MSQTRRLLTNWCRWLTGDRHPIITHDEVCDVSNDRIWPSVTRH